MIATEITFHGIDHSDAAEAAIVRWVARLEPLHDRIEKCTVIVQQPHKRHRTGREFAITVVVDLPGRNITVSHAGNDNIYVTIADAFRAARRQLIEHVDMQRGFVKTHVPERTGNVGVNVAKHRASV